MPAKSSKSSRTERPSRTAKKRAATPPIGDELETGVPPFSAIEEIAGPHTPVTRALVYGQNGSREQWLPEEVFLLDWVQLALAGNWEVARGLLYSFADTSPYPSHILTSYVSKCIREWLASDCDPKKAGRAFHVNAPKHRNPTVATTEKHFRAVEAYLIARGEGANRAKAIATAARLICLDEKTIEPLLKGLHAPGGAFTEIQRIAIRSIELGPRIESGSRPADFLRRCLGKGWGKWDAYRAEERRILASSRRRVSKDHAQ